MRNICTGIQRLTLLLIFGILVASCSGIGKATDIFKKPTARELYQRNFENGPQLLELWEQQAELALFDSVTVKNPYLENGRFFPKNFSVYSYEVALNPGERLLVKLETDTVETLVFLDLYRQKMDSVISYDLIESSEFQESQLEKEISEPGIYKIVLQPEIEADAPFQLTIETEPVYHFPVVSAGNADIQSFWGAIREGGRRSHEGIDIFAPRGTPVVATTKARVTRTGNKGLGGKQVWLRDRERGLSLYYAHLDSIIAVSGSRVHPGDTLGLVGNTGNARTTPSHLHFGIYKGYSGAVNPLHYVYRPISTSDSKAPEVSPSALQLVSSARANLRSGPSINFPVLAQLEARDTVRLLGKSENWYHIRNGNRAAFVHKSLVGVIQRFKDSKTQRFKDSKIQRFKDSKIQRLKYYRLKARPKALGLQGSL